MNGVMSYRRHILDVSLQEGWGVIEYDPLTWTWMDSLLAPDKGDGIPPEGWSTCAGPAWETEVHRVSEGSSVGWIKHS